MKQYFKVTEADIHDGTMAPANCPIARCLQRELGRFVSVGKRWIYDEKGIVVAVILPELSNWIEHFDLTWWNGGAEPLPIEIYFDAERKKAGRVEPSRI